MSPTDEILAVIMIKPVKAPQKVPILGTMSSSLQYVSTSVPFDIAVPKYVQSHASNLKQY